MEIKGQERRKSIKNSDLVEVWFETEKSGRESAVLERICSLLNLAECSDTLQSELSTSSRLFCLNLSKKWKEVSRSRQRLYQRHEDWLQREIHLPESLRAAAPTIEEDQPGPSHPRGRPRKIFEEASLKTKKRRVAELISTSTTDELQFAADMSADTSNKDHISSSLTPQQALALCLDLDLSERKYNILRSTVNAVHPNCFPSLYQLNHEKNALLPSSIRATEISAEVDLQDLIQTTAQSLVNVADLEGSSDQLKLICKWGFDGSSGHSQYKQKFSDGDNTDEYLFLEAMVPLRLTDVKTGRDVWANARASSTLYCRPMKFIFQKENSELVLNEQKKMNEKICHLQTCEVISQCGQRYLVSTEMLFTMMDGSVSNTLTDTNATSKCTICGATPKDMNTQNVLNRPPIVEHYRFGLSTLHCWIRFFECVLHIGYRLPIKSWQVRGSENKEIVENNKKRIQSDFKSKMGLIVDKPKPGYGSTNDGNTARRFFSNPDLSSEITGVDKELIAKFSIILKILASGSHIDLNKFKELLQDTRQLYINLYEWYYMPSSVHKVLVHGCEIIGSFSLPIGQLSEDALEARHKEVRKNRLSHTRKNSRTNSNKDLMRILLLTSDPLISSKRKVTTKKAIRVDDEVQKYLIQEQQPSSSYEADINLDIGVSSDEDPLESY